MDEHIEAGTEEVAGQPDEGTENLAGQPDQEGGSTGEPQPGAEPSDEIGPGHKSYKEIQSAFSKATEEKKKLQERLEAYEKQFQPWGGADKLLEQANQLASDPDFAKWAQNRSKQDVKNGIYEQFGIDPNSDPDTARTVDAIAKITESILEQRLTSEKQKYEQKVSHIENQMTQEKVRGYIDQLRSTPGYEKVDELREEMSKLSEVLSPDKQANPSLEDMQDLFWMAARRAGRLEEFQANAYQKRLETKKQKSSDKPSSSKSGEKPQHFNNIRDSLNNAKKKLGVSEFRW